MDPATKIAYSRLDDLNTSIENGSPLDTELDTLHCTRSVSKFVVQDTTHPSRTSRRIWKSAFWRDTIQDLRLIRWRTKPVSLLSPLVVLLLTITIPRMILLLDISFSGSICRPDGTVNEDSTIYDPWKPSEMFTINVAFGKLSFGQVKLIDVVWDLVVGRGGQALMAFISYRVVTSSLSRLLESRPVTFGTFEAITLQDNTIKALWKLLRDFRNNKSAPAKTIISTALVSVVSVLVFPTLASAMTGYSAVFDTDIKLSDGTSIPASSLQRIWYIIHDGSRLGPGFHDDYIVADSGGDESDIIGSIVPVSDPPDALKWEKSRSRWMHGCANSAPAKVGPDASGRESIRLVQSREMSNGSDCDLLWEVSRYTNSYGLFGMNKTNSTFGSFYNKTEIVLSSPVLNITMLAPRTLASYYKEVSDLFAQQPLAWAIMPYGVSWYQKMHPYQSPYQVYNATLLKEPFAWSRGMYTSKDIQPPPGLSKEYILANAHCRQQGPGSQSAVRYQWGFAYQPLLLCFVLLLLWTLCLYVLHIDVLLNSRLRTNRQSGGLRRSILDIAPQYQAHLEGRDIIMSSDDQIRKLVSKGMLSFKDIATTKGNPTGRERILAWWKAFKFTRWAKDERVWLIVLCLFVILDICTLFGPVWYVWDPLSGAIPISALISIIFIGRNRPSRWILFALAMAMYIVLHTVLVVRWKS